MAGGRTAGRSRAPSASLALRIWLYELRMLASWWWLAAPLVLTLALRVLTETYRDPAARHEALVYPMFESLVPLMAVGFFGSIFVPEQPWGAWEVRMSMPGSRLVWVVRRLATAAGLYGLVWLVTALAVHHLFVEVQLAGLARVSLPGTAALAGLAAAAGAGGGTLAPYLVPVGYWVAHYALLPGGAVGFTLFPEWAARMAAFRAEGWEPDVPTRTARAVHGALGLAAMAAAAAAIHLGRAGAAGGRE